MRRQIVIILLIALTVSIVYADLADAGFVMSDIEQFGLDPFDFVVTSSELTVADPAISFQFHLNYDPMLFDYNGYTVGTELPGSLVVNDLTPGLIMAAYAGALVLEGTYDLISVNLIPLAPCETQLTLSDARYNNSDITNITGGSVIINGIPEVGFVVNPVMHQGISPLEVTVNSTDILAEDEILSYQFCFHYDVEFMTYSNYAINPDFTGIMVVNANEPGLINAAYSGSEVLAGINDLLILTFEPTGFGYSDVYLSETTYNNFVFTDEVNAMVTVYPDWEEIEISVTGADVFIGDEFGIDVMTSLVMPENEILSFQFIMTYDAAQMEYAGYVPGNRDLYDIVINGEEPGVVQAAFASSDFIYGEGIVAGFLFNAISEGTSEVALTEFVYNNEYIANLIPGEVIITNPNNPPVANAGEDFGIYEGLEGMLDGSGSNDPNDDMLYYLWEGELEISDATAMSPTFTAPQIEEDAEYVMTLTVNDGEFFSSDEIVVTVMNVPNPADAVITVETLDTFIDSEFSVGIFTTPLANEFGVISYQYILNYDPAVITFTGYTEGDNMPEGILVVNGTEPGLIQVAFSSADPIEMPLALNYLNFTANEFGYSDLLISEFYYNSISVENLVAGLVNVYVPYYFTEVYAEDIDADLEMEFTCNIITEELLAEWNLISYQFHLYYDPAMLQFTGYQLGDVPAGGSLLAYEVETGHLSVAFADYNALMGAGSLAGFNFIPLQLGETEVVINEFKYNAVYLPEAGNGMINIEIPYEDAVITAPELIVGGGENFIVEINTTYINTAWNVISFQFDLGFDAEYLDYIGYDYGSMITEGNLLAFENADGNVSIAYANFAPISGEGSLIALEFTASPILGESVLDISNFKYNSLYLDDMEDGFITIVEPYKDAVITCSDVETRVGMNFTVDISTTAIQESWNVISFQFNLGFDDAMVDYVGYEAGGVITSGNLLAFQNTDGNVSVAFADFAPIDGVGNLITLEFTAVSNGEMTFDVNQFKYNALYLENMVDGNAFIHVSNYAPIADAGEDQTVFEASLVQLDGTGSSDPDEFMQLRTAPDWSVNYHDFQYNGTFSGTISYNGIFTDDMNDVVGVFVDDECRGIAGLAYGNGSVVDYTEQYGYIFFGPMVYSNMVSGETLTFKVYDASTDRVYDLDQSFPFVIDFHEGDGNNPYIFDVQVDPSDYLDFLWTATAGIVFDDPTSAVPTFTAPLVGEDTDFEIGLSVFDGNLWSEMDNVVITVVDIPIEELVVSAPVLDVMENESINVPITTDEVLLDMSVTSYEFNLAYDADLMNFTGYTAGILSPDILVVNLNQPGLITVAYANSGYLTGAGELVAFQFDTYEPGVSPLDIENFKYNTTLTMIEDGLVNITNVNDTPEFVLPDAFTFNEDEMLEVDFSDFIIDPDNDSHQIIAWGNINTNIGIEGYIVTMSAGENWFGSESLTFMINDLSGRAAAIDFAMINVLSVNDAPVLDVPPVMSFDEDTEMIFDVGEYVTDIENDELTLYVGGIDMLYADVEGLVATITAPENWSGEDELTFTVDDAQGRETAIDFCNFIIVPVNDAPVIELPELITFDEDNSEMFDLSAYISDVENDELAIVSVVCNEENLLYEIDDQMITFSSAQDWFGATEVTISITDNQEREVAEDIFIVEVLAINDAPVLDIPAEMPFDEDTELVFDIGLYVSDVDNTIDQLVLYVNGYTDLMVSIEGLVATITAPLNYNGNEVLNFMVDDFMTRETDADDCDIIVTPVNDAPVIEMPEFIYFDEDQVLDVDILDYAYDVDGDELSIVALDYDEINLYSMIDGMDINFSAAENWFGITGLSIVITDDVERIEVTDVFSVEVLSVNDAPVIELEDSYTFFEDGELFVDFSPFISDIDEDDLILTVVQGENVFVLIDGFGVTFSAAGDWFGNEIITFSIDDQQGRSIASDDVEILVTSVNDSPLNIVYSPAENVITLTDTTFIDFGVDFTDVEGGVEILWYLNGVPFNNENDTHMPITYDRNGDFTVKIEITDGEFTFENLWTITVWMGPTWEPVVYPSSTLAYCRVSIDGLPAATDEDGNIDMVGSFVDGEMRGWSYPFISEEDNLTYATINVNGSEIEEIEFMLYDYSRNEYYELYDTFTTNPGNEIGTPPDFLNLGFGSGEGPNWSPVIYTNSTLLYSIVTIEGIPAAEGDRIGAFVGSECRAVADVVVVNRVTAYATLVIQGNEAEIAHFKVWDASEDITMNVATTIETIPGGSIDVIVLNATTSSNITQEINFAQGWNLMSINVYPESYEIVDIFADFIANENLNKIKDIFNSFDPDLPSAYNTLTAFEDGGAYYVNMTSPMNMEVSGPAVDVINSDISLSAGWNLVGYLPQNSQPIGDALFNIIDVLLKVKDSFGSYDPSLLPEFNTLTVMSGGSGYWIKMYNPATLIYPDPPSRGLNVSEKIACPIWEPVIYPNSTIAYGNAYLNNEPATGFISAFAGEECRAATAISNGIVSLVINGDQQETVTFKLYQNGVVYETKLAIATNPGEDISGMQLYFENDGAPAATQMLGTYPNPFNPETTIRYELATEGHVMIDIYNVRGQLVETLINETQPAGEYKLNWNASTEASGMYFLRFSANGNSKTQKVILMK